MRFLVFMIPAVYQKPVPANFVPDPQMMAEMGKFNDGLRKRGVLLSVDGLQPLTNGVRISSPGGRLIVTDGSSVRASDVVGGFWIVQAPAKDQVIEWFKSCPTEPGDILEIRQLAELSDFPADVQKSARGA